MRISDWSSDVCSSDLVCRIVGLHSGKWPPALQVGSTHLAFGPAPLLKARGGTDVEAPADDIIGCTISGTQTGPNRRRFVRDIGHTGTQRELFVYVDAREEVHIDRKSTRLNSSH